MPRNRTKFSRDWLNCDDGQGFRIAQWCEPSKSRFEAFGFLCKKTVQCDNQGILQLKQHAKGESHKKLANGVLKGQTTLRFVNTSSHCETAGTSAPQSDTGKTALSPLEIKQLRLR